MRPYVICHMMAGLDGKTDPEAIGQFSDVGIYEQTHPQLDGDAWLCGRTTLQVNFAQFADGAEFDNDGSDAVDEPKVHVAGRFPSYAVSADTHGKIQWTGSSVDGDHLVVLTTERA